MAKIALFSDHNHGLESDIKGIASDLNIALRGINTTQQSKAYYTEIQAEVPNTNVLSSFVYLLKSLKSTSRAYSL